MPDIALRFNKDMLVLSTPIDYQLKAQGFLDPGIGNTWFFVSLSLLKKPISWKR